MIPTDYIKNADERSHSNRDPTALNNKHVNGPG